MANVENPIPFERPDSDMFDNFAQQRYLHLIEQSPLSPANQDTIEHIKSLPDADRGDRIKPEIWKVNEYFTESCGIGVEYRENIRLRFQLETIREGTIYEPK